MTCKLGKEKCECVGRSASLRIFCNQWDEPERPRGALETQSEIHWAAVDAERRKACIDLLKSRVPAAVLADWKATYDRGNIIGSNILTFHNTIGMHIRNTLREVIKDSDLPGFASGYHWDDYYVGALHELVQS